MATLAQRAAALAAQAPAKYRAICAYPPNTPVAAIAHAQRANPVLVAFIRAPKPRTRTVYLADAIIAARKAMRQHKPHGLPTALAQAVAAAGQPPLHVLPGTVRFTPAQVAAMRAMHAMGVSASGVANAFGCGYDQALGVCSGRSYRKIPMCAATRIAKPHIFPGASAARIAVSL